MKSSEIEHRSLQYFFVPPVFMHPPFGRPGIAACSNGVLLLARRSIWLICTRSSASSVGRQEGVRKLLNHRKLDEFPSITNLAPKSHQKATNSMPRVGRCSWKPAGQIGFKSSPGCRQAVPAGSAMTEMLK